MTRGLLLLNVNNHILLLESGRGLARRFSVDYDLAIGVRKIEFPFAFRDAVSPEHLAFH